jgi:hypothetical protein
VNSNNNNNALLVIMDGEEKEVRGGAVGHVRSFPSFLRLTCGLSRGKLFAF